MVEYLGWPRLCLAIVVLFGARYLILIKIVGFWIDANAFVIFHAVLISYRGAEFR